MHRINNIVTLHISSFVVHIYQFVHVHTAVRGDGGSREPTAVMYPYMLVRGYRVLETLLIDKYSSTMCV